MQTATVSIMMCTYNGEAFLAEQIDSIVDQTYKDIRIWISDDGSTDRTLEILKSYKAKFNEEYITLLNGPMHGFAENFLSLIFNNEIDSDFFAFSDQDDVWLPDKIERAVGFLQKYDINVPSLYCSNAILVDSCNLEISIPSEIKKPSFRNSLVENIAPGNTMVFNRAAREIFKQIGSNSQIYSHDWIAYMLIMAVGGNLVYDNIPSIRYRQHSNNLIGVKNSMIAKVNKFIDLCRNKFSIMINNNLLVITKFEQLVASNNFSTYYYFSQSRRESLCLRMFFLLKSGVRRQSCLGTIAIYILAIFGKI